jgi:hypothetical protein
MFRREHPFDPARLHPCLALLARNVGAIRVGKFGRRRARDQTGTNCARECARLRPCCARPSERARIAMLERASFHGGRGPVATVVLIGKR